MSFAIGVKILSWVLPIVIGPLVYLAARALLNAHTMVDAFPAFAKRLVVVALGFLVVAVFQVLGVAVPAECVDMGAGGGLTEACAEAINAPRTVQALTGSVVAFLLHALKKSDPRA